jgi:DNA modification methylase
MGKNARTFGQDLMRGEGKPLTGRKAKTRLVPGGGGAGAWFGGRMSESSEKFGRSDGLTWTGAATEFDHYRVKEGTRETTEVSGTSVFDPVLCELVYRWFCPKGGAVLDPFAGGSVRGIVAAKLGLKYTGIDLSERQIEENRKQAQEICPDNPPAWIVGDSRQAAELAPGSYDLIFSCPPYGNLEIYSEDERDLSTLDHADFVAAYRAIIGGCAGMLKPDRFACFVVGDFRDSKGFYRDFPSHTAAAFESAGMRLYNEAILITAVGSLPIRIGKQFGRYRKLGKTHQNVLVFYNGEPKGIPDVLGECEFGDANEASEQD